MEATLCLKDVITEMADILNGSDYHFHQNWDRYKFLMQELYTICEDNKSYIKNLK